MKRLRRISRPRALAAEPATNEFVSLVLAILSALAPFVALKLGRDLE